MEWKKTFQEDRLDIILVQGDINTVLTGGLVGGIMNAWKFLPEKIVSEIDKIVSKDRSNSNPYINSMAGAKKGEICNHILN